MTFADLLPGEAIFLDANTRVYHFVSDPLDGAARASTKPLNESCKAASRF